VNILIKCESVFIASLSDRVFFSFFAKSISFVSSTCCSR